MTIYIDIVIIENLIMNYIILCATAIISKTEIKQIRIILASLIGATYVIMSYVVNVQIYSNIILKIILSIVMVYISYKPVKIKKLGKQILMFYLTSFVFGGVSLALIYFIKPQEVIIKNGQFIGKYVLKTVFLGGIVGFIITVATINIIKNKKGKKDVFYTVKIHLQGKIIETVAMLDTGNLLKEPITNRPVIILEHTLLYEIIPKQILNNLENILAGDFSKIPEEIRDEYISKLKVIPFKSLGKENGMLLGIKCEKVIIENDEEIKEENSPIIGIYNKSLTKRGEYRALVGMDIV
ncbi:MAG: sigma-E processing peptidase SpoIIGA [Clostridia bacterium]|nr:sigma-E processing peptidase SpoIIGA [Clostridia bacterium]